MALMIAGAAVSSALSVVLIKKDGSLKNKYLTSGSSKS